MTEGVGEKGGDRGDDERERGIANPAITFGSHKHADK